VLENTFFFIGGKNSPRFYLTRKPRVCRPKKLFRRGRRLFFREKSSSPNRASRGTVYSPGPFYPHIAVRWVFPNLSNLEIPLMRPPSNLFRGNKFLLKSAQPGFTIFVLGGFLALLILGSSQSILKASLFISLISYRLIYLLI